VVSYRWSFVINPLSRSRTGSEIWWVTGRKTRFLPTPP